MRYFILLFICLSQSLTAQIQVMPTGCIEQVCVPAEYETKTITKVIPAVTYQVPLFETLTQEVDIRDKAEEQYFECTNGVEKKQKLCSRIIEGLSKEITYKSPTGEFETKVISEKQVLTYTYEKKIKDGYVATVPCSNVVGNPLSVNISTTPTTCEANGTNNGTAEAEYNSAGATCVWSNGEKQHRITGLKAGRYMITVTDNTTGKQTVSSALVGDLKLCE